MFSIVNKRLQERSRPLRARSLKRARLALLVTPVLFGSFLLGARWGEYAMTFHPEPYRPGPAWHAPRGGEEASFLNRDQEKLEGWYLYSQAQPALGTIIYFHGTAGNISNVGWLGEGLAAVGFDVLLFDYRGYGKSEGETRDERDLYADADAAYDYVVSDRDIPPERVILYGHSLGSAAAIDLGSRRKCGAIIVESGFGSGREMASIRLPWLPNWLLRMLERNRFDSASKLAAVKCPVLVAHGEPDDIVPTDQGRELFRAAHEPRKLLIVPGAGHSVSSFEGDRYFAEIAKFIKDSLAHGNASQLSSPALARTPQLRRPSNAPAERTSAT